MGEPEEDTEGYVAEDDLGQMLREAEEGCETENESRDLNRMLEAIFISETGLTLEEATGHVEAKIPIARTITPFHHGKPFVTEKEEKSLGTQMFNLHRWYLRMAKDEGKIFGVKYHDHDFFRGEDDFWVHFEDVNHITIDKPSTYLSLPFGFFKYHLPLP